MNSPYFDTLNEFVENAYTKNGVVDSSYKHLLNTVDWVLKLSPDAGDGLILAALSHDVERAFRQGDVLNILKNSQEGFRDKNFLRLHQERGAEIVANFLAQKGASSELVEKVRKNILKHEDGGDEEQNLLKDADSISFFDNEHALRFIEKKLPTDGVEKVINKINWMFQRITSARAKEIAQPMYQEAIQKIHEIK